MQRECNVNALASFVTLNPQVTMTGLSAQLLSVHWPLVVLIVTSNVQADSCIIVLTLYRDISPMARSVINAIDVVVIQLSGRTTTRFGGSVINVVGRRRSRTRNAATRSVNIRGRPVKTESAAHHQNTVRLSIFIDVRQLEEGLTSSRASMSYRHFTM